MMNQAMRRSISLILAAAFMLCAFPVSVFASETAGPETIEIIYHFNPGGTGGGLLPTDKVTWRDDCFLRSSFLGCSHLAEVSAAAALASGPYKNPALTPVQNEPLAPRYIREFLSAAHFQDVETNTYYTVMAEEDSAAAAFGHKTIRDGGRDYTLLAIVIRSKDYAQEWSGNFAMSGEGGDAGKMHAGFKAARDEVLRFAAQYMKDHGISGSLKVWITGHSRGAAVSNALGGFFAGGGDGYFQAAGVPVNVAPENVYCYTFSTPRTIRPGLTHAEDLSVAGNRSAYPNDTPGRAYASTAAGTVNPEDSCYAGIRNYPKDHDLVPKLPPSIRGWEFTYYGRVCRFDSADLKGGPVAESEMVEQLRAFDTNMYKTYTGGGNPGAYKRVILDFDKLVEKICSGEQIVIADIMKPTDKGPSSMAGLMQRRVDSAGTIAATPRLFAEYGFQRAVRALAGLFGMVPLHLSDPGVNYADLASAAAFWILDYGVTRLREEADEGESAAVVRFLEKLLSFLLPGESIPQGSLCIAGIAEMAMRYIFPQQGDTKVSEKVLDLIVPKLPDPGSGGYADIIYAYFDRYVPGEPESYTKAQRIEAFLRACGWGPEDGTKAKGDGETAMDAARNLCSILSLADTFGFLDLPDWLVSALNAPDQPGKFPGQVHDMLAALMPEGQEYQNITTAADLWGKHAAESLFHNLLDSLAGQGYSQEYIEDAWQHYMDLKTYIRPFRTVFMTFLFTTAGEPVSVEEMIRNLSLFAANDGIVAPSHYVQMDLAWAKARRAKGIWDHTPEPSPTPSPTGTPQPVPVTGDSASPLLWIGLAAAGMIGLAFTVGIRKQKGRR